MNEGGGEENITDYNQNYMMLKKKNERFISQC